MVLTRIPFIYACAPEAFSRIRGGPGLVVPSAYDPRNHGPYHSLSLSLFLSVPEENYCAPTGVQSSYPRISVPLLCFPDFIGEETARVLFHPRSIVPVSRNAWFTLIGLFPEGSRCFHLIYRSPTRTSFSISLRIIASLPDSRHSKNESW